MRLRLGAFEHAARQRMNGLTADDAVGRIWRRDASFWGGDETQQRSVANRLGWLDAPSQFRKRVPELGAFARNVRDAGFTDAVLLGMGGSSLAPEVLRRSIAPAGAGLCLHVLDTTDPATILAVERTIDLVHTLFIVSSKSGTTIEVQSLFAHFYDLVRRLRGDHAGEQFVTITDDGTALRKLADERSFRARFINPSDIGGRYSALSHVGLVPAAIAGVDVERLIASAVEQEAAACSPGADAILLGATLSELTLQGRDKCTIIASPGIASLGLWLEQLIAESTGKLGRGILPVDAEPLGHPQAYGPDRFIIQLHLQGDDTAEQDRAVGALERAGHPVIRIDLADPYELGREFVRWELAVAVAGQVLGINPFDEPNVQESKDNTSRVLREFEASGRLDPAFDGSGITAIDGTGEKPDLAGGFAGLLRGLAPPGYLAITAFMQQTPHADAAFAEIRRLVRDGTRAATTLGYGPRFLHSTGQLHKGGPPVGVFLQVTADDPEDIPIPNKPYTFGQLKRAQAVGDFEALVGHGRPILRVHLGADPYASLDAFRQAVHMAIEEVTHSRR